MRYIICLLWMLLFITVEAQVLETKNWCLSKCDLVGDELENTELIFLQLQNDSIKKSISNEHIIKFPLRIGIIQQGSEEVNLKELKVRSAVNYLNTAFEEVGIVFYIDQVDVIISPLNLEDLSVDGYSNYNLFSDTYDIEDMMSIYIFDHGRPFCEVTPTSVRCSRVGGFSYVLSRRTTNVVMSRFDLDDQKVFAHEVGHFFGLYHTFEKDQFGKDDFDMLACSKVGDKICDTPPDPGGVFDIYVNYSTCEMTGHMDEHGHMYKPLVNNYMSYYKPCYMKEYAFTPDQRDYLRLAAHSELRIDLSR